MADVTFDSVELVNSTYIPRYVRHESSPDRELALLGLAREDGAVLISEKYGIKRIAVVGKLTGASRAALEVAIDNFKELFSRKNKTLSIANWRGGTPRSYIAYCERHTFDRDHFHDLFVPWTAEFVVPSGIGKEATVEAFNGGLNADAGDKTFGFGGNRAQKPYAIILTMITLDNAGRKGLSIESQGKKLVYVRSGSPAADFVAGDKLKINCEDKIVEFQPNGGAYAEVGFHGPFPEFLVGENTVSFEVGEVDINEGAYNIGGSGQTIYSNIWRAQSFTIPWKENSMECISVPITVTGTPTSLVLRIETDDGGKPSGTLVEPNAYVITAKADIPGIGTRYKFYFPVAIKLEANTRYWIVAKTSGGDIGNTYRWARLTTNPYSKGNASGSINSGADWTDEPDNDFTFEIWVGGRRPGGNIQMTIVANYYPYYL